MTAGDGERKASVKVLDAWAIIAWLKDEARASDAVDELWERARSGKIRLVLNVINLGEVLYITSRAQGSDAADLVLAELQELPLEIRPAPNHLVLEAARLKARYRISYADAFAVATALREKGTLITGDAELKALKDSGLIEMRWVGK